MSWSCRLSWWEVMAAACWGGGGAGTRSSPFVSLHMHVRGNVLAWAPGSTKSETETASLAEGSEGSGCRAGSSCRPPRARGLGLAGQTANERHEGGLERGSVRGGQNCGNTKGGKRA